MLYTVYSIYIILYIFTYKYIQYSIHFISSNSLLLLFIDQLFTLLRLINFLIIIIFN